ncbi:methionyl-tRNA formyltransferase [Desulfovibrio inopinatus]|uniref:methionyl-tRNA formyltransferase n=1 Tax=Desulfovibrio inopinatus TaxID=102109 RepID=UPI0003FB14B5|nr:methionyl-tRNA formyltransferase [Desulfovibrio inopinatus]
MGQEERTEHDVQQRLNAVFMGTPGIAAAILQRLLDDDVVNITAVYTQPDRPCGRGQKCQPSEVKKLALEHGLPCYQPVNFKSQEAIDELAALAPDVLLVAAYGLILPQAVLDIPRLMPINVHTSLLPKYRGAAPIQRVILDGETVTGVTIMRMEASMDTGPILLQRAMGIGRDETAGQLHDDLADLGGRLLVDALNRLSLGTLKELPQDHGLATHAAKIEKSEAEIDWSDTAQNIHNRIRAMSPKPGPFFFMNIPGQSKPVRLIADVGVPGEPLAEDVPPGQVLGMVDNALAIACADRSYLLPGVRPAGKKHQDAKAFFCGYLAKCDGQAACGPEALSDNEGSHA